MACMKISQNLNKTLKQLFLRPKFSEGRMLIWSSRWLSVHTSKNSNICINEVPLNVQGYQWREHEFSKLSNEYVDSTPEAILSKAKSNECYQQISNVSLYSTMQTNVPYPYTSKPGHLNMPGGTVKLRDKFTSSSLHDIHPAKIKFDGVRQFSSFSRMQSKSQQKVYSYGVGANDVQGVQGPLCSIEDQTVKSNIQDNPCPQGIQGSDCEKFKLWLENCTKYSFLNCNDQLQDLKDGRKTLAQIFEEQEKTISDVARGYQNKFTTEKVGINYTSVRKAHNQSDNVSTNVRMSQKDRLKQAVSQYGATVIVFHIGISLMSLGGFYLAVSR